MLLYSRPRAPRSCRDWSALPHVLLSSLTADSTVYDACCGYIYSKYTQNLLKTNPRAAEPYLHISSYIGNVSLREASTARFSAMFRDEEIGHLASGTINGIIAKLNKLFRALADYGIVPNPFATITRLSSVKVRPPRVLSPEELSHFLAYVDKHIPRSTYIKGTYGDICRLALQTGMRYEELLTIVGSDFDFVTSTLHIPYAKNGARYVVLMPEDILLFSKHFKALPSDRLFPFSYGAISETIAYYNKKFNRNIRFHLLRHTAITHYAEQPGVTIHELKGFSGHQSTKAADVYLHAQTAKNRDQVRNRRLSMV